MKSNSEKQLFPLRKDLPVLSTVVIKVGSRIAAEGEPFECHERLKGLVADITALRAAKIKVLLVCSGAIAHGMKALGLDKRPKNIPDKQACAAIGQYRLMESFQQLFSTHNISVGQVLLTWDDLRDKERYLNLRNTLYKLLDFGVVPIINENDSVGVEEIRFGNNDLLGAQIASLAVADLYVMLTDVNGLYSENPSKNSRAKHFSVIDSIGAATHAMASTKGSEISVGGMATKLSAAELACKAGMYTLIGNGFNQRLKSALGNDTLSTLFLPRPQKMNSRDRWIAFAGKSKGTIIVDSGAQKALVEKGKSLLPAGIVSLVGTFKVGDMVTIIGKDSIHCARGLVNYSSDEIQRVKGCSTQTLRSILGNDSSTDEIVHRDNMVLLG